MADDKITLYHYTDANGLEGIAKNNVIRQSVGANKNDDAVFGDGAYLTSKPPEIGKFAVAENNWDDSKRMTENAIKQGKVDYYVEVTVDKDQVTKCVDGNRDVYKYDGDLRIKPDMNPGIGRVTKK